jgi:hypothetical protein
MLLLDGAAAVWCYCWINRLMGWAAQRCGHKQQDDNRGCVTTRNPDRQIPRPHDVQHQPRHYEGFKEKSNSISYPSRSTAWTWLHHCCCCVSSNSPESAPSSMPTDQNIRQVLVDETRSSVICCRYFCAFADDQALTNRSWHPPAEAEHKAWYVSTCVHQTVAVHNCPCRLQHDASFKNATALGGVHQPGTTALVLLNAAWVCLR